MSYGVPNNLKAVIVSDIHLGYQLNNISQSNENDFRNFVQIFLANKNIEHFIMLGDIIDLWRRDSSTVIGQYDTLMTYIGNLPSIGEIHYIVGNHDFLIETDPRKANWGFKFNEVLPLAIAGKKFKFIHGYQIEYRNILDFYKWICETLCGTDELTGDLANHTWNSYVTARTTISELLEINQGWLIDLINRDILENPNNRSLRYRALGIWQKIIAILQDFFGKESAEDIRKNAKETKGVDLEEDEFLVFGHTHDAFNKQNIANAGCWIKGNSNTFLYIDTTGSLFEKNWP